MIWFPTTERMPRDGQAVLGIAYGRTSGDTFDLRDVQVLRYRAEDEWLRDGIHVDGPAYWSPIFDLYGQEV